MNPEISVKILFNDEMRRFSFQGASFNSLKEKIASLIGLNGEFTVKYRDEDGDLVTLCSDLELQTAIVPGKVLRLQVTRKDVVNTLPQAQLFTVSPAPAHPSDIQPMDIQMANNPCNAFGMVPAHPPPGFFGPPHHPPQGHRGPQYAPHGPGPYPCGKSREEWHKFKEEWKNTKKTLSREEWQAYKKENKHIKEALEQARHDAKHAFKDAKKACKKGGKWGFGHPPHGHHGPHNPGPYPCGEGKEEWHKFKEEWKKAKKTLSREEWEAYKKEHKAMKEAHRQACKEGKKASKECGKRGRGGHYDHPHHGPHHGFPPYGPHHGFSHRGFPHGFPHHDMPFPPFPHLFGGGFGGPGLYPNLGQQAESKLVARHVKDVTIEDGMQIPAGTPFVKTWRVRNEGPAWPAGCQFLFLSKRCGDNMSGPDFVTIEKALETNEEVDVSVNLIAPTKPGRYTGFWKLCTPNGRKFGQRMWVSIVVPTLGSSSSDEEEKLADHYEVLVDTVLAQGFTVKRHRVFRLLEKFNGDVQVVSNLLADKAQRKAERAARV